MPIDPEAAGETAKRAEEEARQLDVPHLAAIAGDALE